MQKIEVEIQKKMFGSAYLDTEDFMNQYIIRVCSAQCTPCKASGLVSFLLTLWD